MSGPHSAFPAMRTLEVGGLFRILTSFLLVGSFILQIELKNAQWLSSMVASNLVSSYDWNLTYQLAYLLSLILVELLFSENPGKPVCMPKDMWQMSLRILSVLGSEVKKRTSALNKCWDLCQRNYTTFQTSTETLDLSALEELDQSSVKYFE